MGVLEGIFGLFCVAGGGRHNGRHSQATGRESVHTSPAGGLRPARAEEPHEVLHDGDYLVEVAAVLISFSHDLPCFVLVL